MGTVVKSQLTDITEGWSKWQVAACVGAPIALGLAGLWYYNRSKPKQSSKSNSKDKTGSEKASSVSKADKPVGPQEEAQKAKAKGNKLFKDGEYEKAIECYTQAISVCPTECGPDLATFHQNRAAAYENLKNYSKVIEDCDSALRLNPKYSKALARRSKAREHLALYREALEDITTACLIEAFQNQAYLQAADRVLKALGRDRASKEFKTKKPTEPSKFYIKNYFSGFVNDPVALCFKSQDTPEESLKELNVHVKDEDGASGDKASAFDRAKAALESASYGEILSLCDEELANTDSPYKAQCLLMRGTFKLLHGLGDSAIEDLETVANMEGLQPNLQATALVRVGSLKMQNSPDDGNLAYFTKAETVSPKNSDAFHHHGQQLLQLERLDAAIEKFDKSITLSPDFPTSYVQKYYSIHRKAIVREDMTLLNAAKSGFERTIKQFPDCGDALILYAQTLSDQGKFEDAEKNFIKAHEVQPQNANNLVHRGLMCLQWKGDVQKTLGLLDQALATDPACQYAYEIRGTIEVQRGNLAEAVKSFQKAIALSNSQSEMAHLFSLMEAAEVQVQVAKDLNIQLPSAMMA